MKSNYEPLGKHIQLVDYRNSEEVTSTVLGISIDKEFMPSVANVIGTDLSRYMRTPLCKISSTGEIEQRFRLN